MSRCSGFFLLLSPNSTLDQSHSEPSPGLPILFLTTSNDHATIIMVIMMIMLNFVAIILLTRVFQSQDLDCRLFFLKSFLKSFAVFEFEFHLKLFNSQFDFISIIDFQCNLDQKEFAVRLCKKVEIAGRYAVIFL